MDPDSFRPEPLRSTAPTPKASCGMELTVSVSTIMFFMDDSPGLPREFSVVKDRFEMMSPGLWVLSTRCLSLFCALFVPPLSLPLSGADLVGFGVGVSEPLSAPSGLLVVWDTGVPASCTVSRTEPVLAPRVKTRGVGRLRASSSSSFIPVSPEFGLGWRLWEVLAVLTSSSCGLGEPVRERLRGVGDGGGGDRSLGETGHCSGGSPDFVSIAGFLDARESGALSEEGGGRCGLLTLDSFL